MRKPPSIALFSVALLGLFGFSSMAASETPPPPSASASSSDLVQTPVTKIFPGDVDLAPKVKSPVADDAAAAERGRKYFANFNCVG